MAQVLKLKIKPELQSDEHLALSAAKGEISAFEHLVKKYRKRLYHLIIRIVIDHDDAEDVVQETFIRVYQNLHKFNPEMSFYTWLYKITVNAALNNLQKKKRRYKAIKEFSDLQRINKNDSHNPENEMESNEIKTIVQEGLGLLSPDIRTVFVLRVYEGRSYKEITDILQISMGTVMSRLNRARNCLRKFLHSKMRIKQSLFRGKNEEK